MFCRIIIIYLPVIRDGQSSVTRYVKIISQQWHPIKFLASRFLMRTGLCRLFRIRQDGFELNFFPTSLSAALWIEPDDRHSDAEFFRCYLRPGDRVIDVGANVGSTTLAAWVAVGADGIVEAIDQNYDVYLSIIIY